MNEEIDIILTRYFCGEASEKELQTLDRWLAKSEENEKLFQQMLLLYQHTGKSEEVKTIDTDKAWEKFNTHIAENQKNKTFFITPVVLKIAAAITILLVSGFALFYLIPQSSKTIKLSAAETSVDYEIFENTNVTLFANSELIYTSKTKNKITLIGKATFTIDSKTSVATGIVVQAGETFIKDIGTVFTVDATQPDKFILVDVSEGEVLFYSNTNTGISVKANESAIFDVVTKEFSIITETQFIEPSKEFAPDLLFNNTLLHDAIEIINARYGVNIIIDSEMLNEVSLNASFEANEPLENILEIIAVTFDAQLSKKGNTFIISQ